MKNNIMCHFEWKIKLGFAENIIILLSENFDSSKLSFRISFLVLNDNM